LRRLALATHKSKRAHAEGAAAFAVLVSPERRAEVVRALVAFQAMYDYLDTVSEQPGGDPLTNGWRLHAALVVATDPSQPHLEYYALHPQRNDGGYLRSLADACRDACRSLPSFLLVAPLIQVAAVRAMESQGYNHAVVAGMAPEAVIRWAQRINQDADDLRWWELVGAAGSSLVILALIAAAADPRLDPAECDAISRAYYPWAGALLALMDSLVDEVTDERCGTHSLTARYRSPAEAAQRVSMIAQRAMQLAGDTRDGRHHSMIVAAMVALFASEPEARRPRVCKATAAAVTALGDVGVLPMLLLRARRRIRALWS
jgi:tetraprenyl-beta-curcumene synthase